MQLLRRPPLCLWIGSISSASTDHRSESSPLHHPFPWGDFTCMETLLSSLTQAYLYLLSTPPFSHPNRRSLSRCSFPVVVIFPHLHLLRVALNIHPVGTASTQTSSFCSSRAALRMVTVEVEEDKYRKVNFNHVANFEGHLKERMFCIHMIKIQTD